MPPRPPLFIPHFIPCLLPSVLLLYRAEFPLERGRGSRPSSFHGLPAPPARIIRRNAIKKKRKEGEPKHTVTSQELYLSSPNRVASRCGRRRKDKRRRSVNPWKEIKNKGDSGAGASEKVADASLFENTRKPVRNEIPARVFSIDELASRSYDPLEIVNVRARAARTTHTRVAQRQNVFGEYLFILLNIIAP